MTLHLRYASLLSSPTIVSLLKFPKDFCTREDRVDYPGLDAIRSLNLTLIRAKRIRDLCYVKIEPFGKQRFLKRCVEHYS